MLFEVRTHPKSTGCVAVYFWCCLLRFRRPGAAPRPRDRLYTLALTRVGLPVDFPLQHLFQYTFPGDEFFVIILVCYHPSDQFVVGEGLYARIYFCTSLRGGAPRKAPPPYGLRPPSGALGGQRTAHKKHMEALCPPKKLRGVRRW